MGVTIVSDTCHSLPAELLQEYGIRTVSLYVHMQGDARREGDMTDLGAYYEHLRTAPELPTTSQPSIGDFLAVYEPLLEAGEEIVSVHLAGGMSGTVRSAEQAREQLGEPRSGRVHVLDSATACGGEGFVVLAAGAAARAGRSGAEVAA